MKSVIFAIVLVSYLNQATAAPVRMMTPKSKVKTCGLPDTTADQYIIESNESLDISRLNNQELLTLPVLLKKQLIAAAFSPGKLRFDNATLLKAVKFLMEGSEAGDLNVTHLRYKNKVFTYVRSYPGGNEGGTIFPFGSAEVLAGVGDQDIQCVR